MNRIIVTTLALVALTLSAVASGSVTEEEILNLVLPPQYSNVALSPNGQRAAATVRVDRDYNMVILDISDPRQPTVTYSLQQNQGESINSIRWANDERVMYTTTDTQAGQNEEQLTGRIYAINYNGKRGRVIMGAGVGVSFFSFGDIIDLMPDDKYRILVRSQPFFGDRGPIFEILNIYTGKRSTVETSPFDAGQLFADSKNRARFASKQFEEDLSFVYAYKPDPEGEWVEFENPFDAEVDFISINDSGTKAVFRKNDFRDSGIIELDLETREYRFLSSHPKVAVSNWIVEEGEDGDEVVAVIYEPDSLQIEYLNPDSRWVQLHKGLSASFPGMAVFFTLDEDRLKSLMTVWSDRQPARYFALDPWQPSAVYLFDSRPGVDADDIGTRQAYWIEARDGLDMQVYVTRPANAPEGPMPAVVVPHGGPFYQRDGWSFDGFAEIIARQGYAVIQPNFRGSGGRGEQFVEMGFKRWGLEMQDDVTDATLWAFEEGIADANRTCIFGWSYGGYATLAGVIKEPELYTCAFAMAGVYDLPLMERRGDTNDTEGGRTFLDQAIGSDRTDMEARSPAYNVESIVTPLYVAQGKADIRVPVQQFYSLTNSLDEAGIPYESLLIPNEAHTLYNPENIVNFWQTLSTFLDKHIGPESAGKARQSAASEPAAP